MKISIDQMTTVVSTMPLKAFLEKKAPAKSGLYFHIVLKMNGEITSEENRALLKKYIVGYVRATGGAVQAITVAQNRLHILAGLQMSRSAGNFVSELKLVSKTFARRRLEAENFTWLDEYEAFTVSLSQIDRVKSYIRRQTRLEKQESYASSWQRIGSERLF